MSGSQLLLLGGVPAAVPVDPYFYSVTSLLHGDGTNGGQNNTFLDSSTNNFTITRNGNTTQGSFSPFSQTGWSNYFDGSSNLVTTASQVIPTGSFTIEAWAFVTSSSATQTILAQGTGVGDAGRTWIGIESSSGAKWAVQIGGTQAISSLTPVLNSWTHVAMTYNGSTITLYVNGISVASASVTQNASNTTLKVGANWGAYNLTGYVSNARVSNSVIYTSNFTPSTSPFSAAVGTVFLSCQSNRFVDTSSNAYAITTSGTPSVQPFSPFNPTTAYSASSIGGSGYFDGSGDYLTATLTLQAPGTGDFTYQFWVYAADNTAVSLFDTRAVNNNTTGFTLLINGTSNLAIYTNSTILTGSGTVPLNAWSFVTVTRSGTTLTIYLNGTSQGTVTFSNNLTDTAMRLGQYVDGTGSFTGYIAGFKYVKGSADSASVPTTPPTATTGTQFLCNFTNGAIFDNAAVADYETVGNAQISTSVKKYGTGSMSFDGSGDYLKTNSPTADSFVFGTGDFTIEMWVYVNSLPGTDMVLYDGRPSNGAYPCIILQGSTNKFIWYANTAAQITGSTPATSTWYHLAVCRVASQTKMFVNGTQVGSTYADTTNYLGSGTRPYIGANATNGLESFNGYIDDLRITKGVGRYQYNFTPPEAAFPDIGGTVTLTADPYFENTTLLLPGNGTNGAQNNTFLDSSTNAFTITRNGNTTQGTFSPFSQTGWGNYFNFGTPDALRPSATGISNFGTGAFTIEFWISFQNTSPAGIYYGGTTGSIFIDYFSGSLRLGISGGSIPISYAFTPAVGIWYHVAFVRSSTTDTLYINGTSVATGSDSQNYPSDSGPYVGSWNGGTYTGAAYLSNVRVVKGTAVYTANFTPSTIPLTAISGTSLLTCQSSRFLDNSSNAFAITTSGSPSVQAFSPFNPTASWSAATYGGSGYFDGSGDYLQAGTNANLALGSGDFTIEGWHYCTGYNGGGSLYSTINTYPSSTGLLFYIDSIGRYTIDVNGTILQPAGTAVLNAWVHWAVVRNGSTLSIYINGTSIGSVSSSTNYTDQYAVIGRTGAGTNSNLFLGYLSNTRMVKGTAVYTANFTPPTAPLTAITNTQLLCNFTNAGIYDATSKNDLETVGNAQISTTQSKFGGSSMYFDGNGDYLYVAPAQNLPFLFGSGDFTVEGWIYPSGVSGTQYIASVWGIVGQSDTTFSSWVLRTNAANLEIVLQSGATTTVITGSGSGLATNTWQHVAVTRYGNTVKLFINGAQVVSSSYSSTLNSPASAFVVGLQLSNNNTFTGYIDDLRITKGIARYTSNFTPPTTAFLTL